MSLRHVVLGVALTGLAACGAHEDSAGIRTDQDYANAMDVGRESFDMTRAKQAESQFRTAYDRALLRDDSQAIRDSGYNMGIAQLDADEAQAALKTTARTRQDLVLRGATPGPGLALIDMAAYCRLGQFQQALAIGRQVQTDDPALAERRAFLTGLAADGVGDTGALVSARNALPHSSKPPALEQADQAELDSRLALRQNAFSQAEKAALEAVTLRRNMLDYRGMARGLDCAANAARASGQTERAAAYAQRAAESRAQVTEKS